MTSLRTKILFIIFKGFIVLAVAIAVHAYFQKAALSEEQALRGMRSEARVLGARLQLAFGEMENDAHTLAFLPPIQPIAETVEKNSALCPDIDSLQVWKNRLQTIFTSLMKVRPHYNQLRFIGIAHDGREMVRVDRTKDGLISTPCDNLQSKSGEPYYKTGLNLKPNESAFSDVTLNRENGIVYADSEYTIRAIVPVYKPGGDRLIGLIVVNSLYEALVRQSLLDFSPQKYITIVNQGGLAIDYQSNKGFSDIYSIGSREDKKIQLVESVFSSNDGETDFSEADELGVVKKLDAHSGRKAEFSIILSSTRNAIYRSLYSTVFTGTIVKMLLIFLIMGIIAIAINKLLTPLNDLTRSIAAAGGNPEKLDLPVHRNDDIGELARAFRLLLTDLDSAQILAQNTLENAVDAIITIDEAGDILSFNPSAEKMFGHGADEILGNNIKMLMPEPYHSAHDGYLQNYIRTGAKKIIGSRREVTGLRKDGKTFPLDLSVCEVQLKDKRLFSGFIRDLTHVKKRESEREYIIDELEKSNKALDEFAYIASHDLKAPLRVIDNASRWLEEDLDEHLTGENRENMDLLRQRVVRMENLLNDLLEYSRVGRKTDRRFKEVVSGKKLIEDLLLLLDPPESFEIIISPAFDTVQVNRMPLAQILLNLVSNAIKHHDKDNGCIELNCTDEGAFYHFEVKDDGPGIPAEYHEKVFKMFQTLKPRDQVEGSGIGLSIVKKNIEAYGGKLSLESGEGRGCIFRFTWLKQQTRNADKLIKGVTYESV